LNTKLGAARQAVRRFFEMVRVK